MSVAYFLCVKVYFFMYILPTCILRGVFLTLTLHVSADGNTVVGVKVRRTGSTTSAQS